MDLRTRFRGSLLGLAAGDAVGTTVEFRSPGSFPPLTDMVGGGPFNLPLGAWTDDTSMALCLAESLVECAAFDARDQMQRYVRWRDEGYLSSTDRCFDIGGTVAAALARFAANGVPFAGSTDPNSAGNGSLMRLAPVVLAYANAPDTAIRRAADSSRTTHGAPAALDACRFFAALLLGALQGRAKDELLMPRFSPVPGLWEREPLHPLIDQVALGSYRERRPPEIAGTGYVVRSLEAALWAFAGSDSFRDGCLLAANLGDDADTTAAIYGQLAGAFYGVDAIPERWRSQVVMAERITELADSLLALAEQRIR